MLNDLTTRDHPAAMTIAGSDSGGGAGIQADLRTFNYFRVFGTSAITAVTFQNPLEVTGIEAVSAAGVRAQIETVRKAVDLKAAKTGMLFSAEIIEAAAEVQNGEILSVKITGQIRLEAERIIEIS